MYLKDTNIYFRSLQPGKIMTEVPGEDLAYCLHGRIACLELTYNYATISMLYAALFLISPMRQHT